MIRSKRKGRDIKMLKAVIVSQKKDIAKKLAKELESVLSDKILFDDLELSKDIIGDIKKRRLDLLLTVDLAGFDRCTLTDNIAFNLLDCKQIHFLFNRDLSNEQYLEKMLSIAMFFYCTDEEYKNYLVKRYPHIPWLKCLNGWTCSELSHGSKNIAAMKVAIEEVIQESRLI